MENVLKYHYLKRLFSIYKFHSKVLSNKLNKNYTNSNLYQHNKVYLF
jgi:hypothetical protein